MNFILKISSLLLFWNFGFSQSTLPKNVADSLWGIWKDETFPDTIRIRAIHKYIWDGYMYTKPDSAFYYASLQLDFAKKCGLKREQSFALNALGVSHYLRSEYVRSIDYLTQSLKIKEEIGDNRGVANTLVNIGLIYQHQSDFPEAINHFQLSMKINEGIGNKSGKASCYINLGNIYYEQGNLDKAVDSYVVAMKLKEEIGDKKGIANAIGNIGNIYEDQGEYEKALDYYTRSLRIREEIGDKSGISLSLIHLGLVYYHQGDSSKAIYHYNRSLKIREEIGDKQGLANTLNNIGDIYYDQGKYTESIEFYTRSLTIAKEIPAHIEIKTASRNLVLAYNKLFVPDSAKFFLDILKDLREVDIKMNFFSLTENEKQLYFSTLEYDFGLYYEFATSFNNIYPFTADTAYNIALMNKGLTLKSSTAIRKAIMSSGDSLLMRDYEKWVDMRRTISELFSKGHETKGLENEANDLEKELVKLSTDFGNFSQVMDLNWKQVQASLKPGECAIEFVNFKSEIDTSNVISYSALLVKPDSEHPEIISLCNESDIVEILGTFQGNNYEYVKKVYGSRSEEKKALYEKVWMPMEKSLIGIRTVYYSPSGLLHKISFASISKDKDVFLSDLYNFHQVGSTGKVVFNENVALHPDDNVFLIGGVDYNGDSSTLDEANVWSYLPGTLSESERINDYLSKKKLKVNYYSLFTATEEVFKEQISHSSVAHISTHGFFFPDPELVRNEMKADTTLEEDLTFRGTTNYANWSFVKNKNPLMRSGLVLAGANSVWNREPLAEGEDGILTAQEVSNLDLSKTKLVVLSACETGLGDIKGSEGVYGLQRAFKMAGVKYIIMSLWQVPDKETAEFMTLFYKNLTKVSDVRKAFTMTQKTMREKYDPYYWGAFVLIE